MVEASVLIVDDEADVRDIIASGLRAGGFSVSTAPNGYKALDLVRESHFEVAVIDLYMPGMSGLDTARRVKEIAPGTEIIICTGLPSLESAIESIRESVFDYICKPATASDLRKAVQSAVERHRAQTRSQLSRHPVLEADASEQGVPVLIGESPAMAEVRQMINEVAPSDMTVLIRGETGTGKDLVAQLIHCTSGRHKRGAFIKINCPAIPETLLESELFGHEVGAFTGAQARKPGRFEMAGGGTVFLDEIGAIPAGAQAKLLQAIESRQFTRLGGNVTVFVGARFVAATNELLERGMESGRFRSDLYYRLNEFSILLPPLRQRAGDIPPLVRHFLRKHGRRYSRENLELSSAALTALAAYDWPGNVRELETVVKRFVLTGSEATIQSAVKGKMPEARLQPASSKLRESEIQAIMSALAEAKWNQRQASRTLGISYSTLRRKMARYGIKAS